MIWGLTLRRRKVPPPPAPSPPPDPEIAARLERVQQAAQRLSDPYAALVDFAGAVAMPATRTAALVQSAPLARRLRGARHPRLAREVALQALKLATGEELRLTLRAELLGTDLDLGDVPPRPELAEIARELMAAADRRVAAGTPGAALTPLRTCLDLLLHRTLHTDDLVSPLADDAAGFLRPLHASRTYDLLTAPRPRARAWQRPAGRPLRLLFVTATHFRFLEPVLARYEGRDDVEVRLLHVGRRLGDEPPPKLTRLSVERLARLAPAEPDAPPRTPPGPAAAVAELAWADVVVAEWCDDGAVWASLAVPDETRLIVRLHSVEAFSLHPHFVDWSRVDDLVTVSEPIDRLLSVVAPGTLGPRRWVLPNPVVLDDLPTDKSGAADRTVALVGWASPVKDPMFALDVLAALREHDPAWRLLLIGTSFMASERPRSAEYRRRYEQRLRDDPALAAAVTTTGQVDQVARPDYGFVLSCSLRESFAVGLMEATASGAVPVVRDWPVVKAYGGARSLVPADWVVDDVAGAVARILAFAEPGRRAEEGRRARQIMLDRYDWSAHGDRYDTLLLG